MPDKKIEPLKTTLHITDALIKKGREWAIKNFGDRGVALTPKLHLFVLPYTFNTVLFSLCMVPTPILKKMKDYVESMLGLFEKERGDNVTREAVEHHVARIQLTIDAEMVRLHEMGLLFQPNDYETVAILDAGYLIPVANSLQAALDMVKNDAHPALLELSIGSSSGIDLGRIELLSSLLRVFSVLGYRVEREFAKTDSMFPHALPVILGEIKEMMAVLGRALLLYESLLTYRKEHAESTLTNHQAESIFKKSKEKGGLN